MIPALLGVGGSLLYLMETGTRRYLGAGVRAGLSASSSSANAGLLRVDHIAQTMHYEEMLSWLLYYSSLFELSKAPAVQVADPLGLVQSQAIESPEGGLRFTLNGSSGNQTLSARFLQGFHGAGVQHIALATADILATARRLKELGLATLPIRETTMMIWRLVSSSSRRRSSSSPSSISSTTVMPRESISSSTRVLSRSGFFFEIVERRGYRAYGTAERLHPARCSVALS